MDHVAKIIEIVGTSDDSIEDAITGAVARAAETIDKLRRFDVTELRREQEPEDRAPA